MADLVAMVERFSGSPMRARIAAAGARHGPSCRSQFTLATGGGRSLLVNGVVDVHAEEADRVLVVDYKSDRLGEQRPGRAHRRRSTSTQRLVYALAALRSGAERVEVAYVFLERPETPVAAGSRRPMRRSSSGGCTELAAGVTEGRFEPTRPPHRGLCPTARGGGAVLLGSGAHAGGRAR